MSFLSKVRVLTIASGFGIAFCSAAAAGQGGAVLEPFAVRGMVWRSVGPAQAGGRVTDIEVHPTEPYTFYLGTASGGVFKSTNHGTTWTPIFDDDANQSVGDIAIARGDPRVVWVGTGEANSRNSSPYGEGVYKSTDGGVTWQRMGLEETRHIGRVVIHPTDPNLVYVAAMGHLFGPNPDRGIYRTKDGGGTWELVKWIDENTGFVDLAMHSTDPRTLFAAAYQRRRHAYGFAGGGPGSGLYKSTDGGDTWREVTRGLPGGNKGRIGFAISARNPDLVLALVEASDGGVFRSLDRGESWTRLNSLNPRPMYYSKIRIDPNDDDLIYVLGTEMHRSTDGGRSFEVIDLRNGGGYGEGVHGDAHALWIDPSDSDHLLLGNDGGFYSSFDRGLHWNFAENLPIQQFYDIAYDMEQPYRIFGGLQDNKSQFGPNATRRYEGVLNRDWMVMDFGDGMYTQADPTDSRIAYASSQGGAIIRIDTRTGDRKSIRPFAEDGAEYRFNWTSPILISPHDPRTLYLGGNRLFTSRDRGENWSRTEDLTRRIRHDTLRIMGIVPDSTTPSRHDGVMSYSTISTISESPLRAGVVWVGTDDGNVQVSRDGGASWTETSASMPGLPRPTYVSRVEASRAAPGRAYASLDGHWDDDYRPYVYVTDDYGRTWRSISSALPIGSVNVVREHPRNPNVLFVGTENGVFVSADAGSNWLRLNNNMPHVPVDDLEIHPRENDLIAGTHGRGIWILDDIGSLSGFDAEVATGTATLFDIRPATVFQYWNNVPEVGQGTFSAANPPFGALIDYFVGPASPGAGRATLHIQDVQGCRIRSMDGPGHPGFHRVVWDLRLAPHPADSGIVSPTMDAGSRGPLVLPGAYTIQLEVGGTSQVNSLEVRPDPLMPISAEERRRRFDFVVEVHRLQTDGSRAAMDASEMERKIASAVASVEARDGVNGPDRARATAIRDMAAARARDLRRQNSDLRSWFRGLVGDFKGGPTTQGSMTGPTPAQVVRLRADRAEFQRAFTALDEMIGRGVPELNGILDRNGIPAIEVARRTAREPGDSGVCNPS